MRNRYLVLDDAIISILNEKWDEIGIINSITCNEEDKKLRVY